MGIFDPSRILRHRVSGKSLQTSLNTNRILTLPRRPERTSGPYDDLWDPVVTFPLLGTRPDNHDLTIPQKFKTKQNEGITNISFVNSNDTVNK